jgi:uncharacterized protein YutE (UPF0331/DUF86 family)
MVDRALVLRKLADLEEYLGQTKEYENVTVEQYAKDWKIQRVLERTLQMIVETCAVIAGHIISERGYIYLTDDLFKIGSKQSRRMRGLVGKRS